MKLSIREKFGYSLGDTASHFVWDLVGFWLLIFYTDIYGLTPALAGVIMFVGSIWDVSPTMPSMAPSATTPTGAERACFRWPSR